MSGDIAQRITAERQLRMEYAGGLVQHLGLSMYRGAVPALAELIANAWDADANRVDIEVPFGIGLGGQEIKVADDGRGMTWQDCQDHYLVVGRDRRKANGTDRSPAGRIVMGRKGLGKLAGFGIAKVVEVRTVRDGWLTHFQMDFDRMTEGGEAALVERYSPTMLADCAVSEPNGTVITLKRLVLTRAINEDEFRDSMSRRFSILSNQFQVAINGIELLQHSPDLQFVEPSQDGGWEEVPGVGTVWWRIGFTERPIQIPDARGIAIVVRGKMQQVPFFFDLIGGTHGQVGMQYMTGTVVADQLDGAVDYISTDRQGILWSEPMPLALREWGEAKVRSLLAEWSDLRSAANEKKLLQDVFSLDQTTEDRISLLQPVEQREVKTLLKTLAGIPSITDEPNRARQVVDLVLRAFEDSSFLSLLQMLDTTSPQARVELEQLIRELDVLDVVRLAQQVRARIGVIRKFKQMIDDDVREKPDMQNFLFNHPWLIDPEWSLIEHEVQLETLIVEKFNLDPSADPDSDRRVDFFCCSSRGRFLVVEVKRPSQTIGKSQVSQIIDYIGFLREYGPSAGEPRRAVHYEGLLVGNHMSEDGKRWAAIANNEGISVRTWSELLSVAERIHAEFLDIAKERAPDDVRVQSLPSLEEPDADLATNAQDVLFNE